MDSSAICHRQCHPNLLTVRQRPIIRLRVEVYLDHLAPPPAPKRPEYVSNVGLPPILIYGAYHHLAVHEIEFVSRPREPVLCSASSGVCVSFGSDQLFVYVVNLKNKVVWYLLRGPHVRAYVDCHNLRHIRFSSQDMIAAARSSIPRRPDMPWQLRWPSRRCQPPTRESSSACSAGAGAVCCSAPASERCEGC